MSDKFILMNLEDDNSKKIAEVMGNKTSKAILNHLGDVSDASQKDISDALKIPMNTMDYNMKKLLGVGLIEKTKKFFWSKKGKKIPMYKLARKHIIISPKSMKPNMNALKTILPVILAIGFLFIFLAIQNTPIQEQDTNTNKFENEAQLVSFIKKNKVSQGGFGDVLESAVRGVASIAGGAKMTESSLDTSSSAPTAGSSSSSSGSASDYSETNIQVKGVDEADIVKNDGKYIYTVTGNKVVIVEAYPADNMEVLSEIETSQVSEIFVNGDRLVVFSRDYHAIDKGLRCVTTPCHTGYTEQLTNIDIYDISDRENPKLEHEYKMSGDYFSSRMIDDYVYVVANQHIYDDIIYPVIYEDGYEKVIEAEEISYSDIRDYNFRFTNILGIDLDNGETNSETTLTGYTSNIYVSQENIFLTQYKYGGWYRTMEDNQEKTFITKISIDKLDIEHKASGEVPGNILNQFSMDENDNYFRIATTSRTNQNLPNRIAAEIAPSPGIAPSSTVSNTQNNVYILDKNLEIVGELEGLAPGESIYSVRFMGEKAYIVTFKKVDPLFVLDLSNPENPKVLGKLKIPGYSDYLHPYDENHIIGIGKDAEEAEYGDFAWYQGVKIAIFDVTDPENPIEMHKVIIGDRGTQSEALNDHKAFLFDREKELLVIPIQLYEIQGEKTSGNTYGQYAFQGAYVYNINLDEGFDLKGKITHVTDEEELKAGYYYDYNTQVRRSLYMDDTLYTISNKRIKANDLDDIDEINVIDLPLEKNIKNYKYGIAEEAVAF